MSEPVKILTICQPWAHLIIHGLFDPEYNEINYKDIENRKWWTDYKGPVLIHAGKSRSNLHELPYFTGLAEDDLAFGAVIGQVEQHGCVPFEKVRSNRWAIGPWCHLYRNPVAFPEPIPWKGQLGLRDAPPELLAKVANDLALREVR